MSSNIENSFGQLAQANTQQASLSTTALSSKSLANKKTSHADDVAQKVQLSSRSKEIVASKAKLDDVQKQMVKEIVKLLQQKNVELKPTALNLNKEYGQPQKSPGIFFISGFDYFGLTSDEADGILHMSKVVPDAKHFSWDNEEKIIRAIKKVPLDMPIVLVGHSFGGDAAVSIANKLNSIDQGMRKIDLLITLDSVGFDNDIIPENVVKNINYFEDKDFLISDGPNAARDNRYTTVINEYKQLHHQELDNSPDIQRETINHILEVVQQKT
ncbi:MAG: hypothetical protein ISR65_17630 [Bacteriovoracaceae bacterium]|nr:hypothetical protein [Bacteriovoracaceae bacterium]